VSANLSPAQLCSNSIVAVVAEAVREGGGNPALFELEITETALLQDAEASARRLGELKSLDISLSLDDFGTGYSSLSYLKSFPVDTVKIDRSFVEGLGTVASDTAVTAAVVSLSRALGLRVVAEGVETETQWKELRGLGCHEAQGFLFSRPIDPDAFEALLRATPSLGQETKTIASL
jgi:EAL domain-containing protein (putative c-di-GMP-specific phosphodiesterase class I)